MKIKAMLIKSCVAMLMLLAVSKISFGQQVASSQKTQTVIYKLQKSDYEANGNGLQKSLLKINGITIDKFCDLNGKVFLILQVNRILQPDDNNITNAISTHQIGYKKVDGSNEVILNSCN